MIIETIPVGPIYTNCYIFSEDGERAVIIDPGAEAGVIAIHLRALEVEPVAIVNTHGHLDHIGANADLRELLGVPIFAGAGDDVYFGNNAGPVHRQDALLVGPEAAALFQEFYVPSPRPDGLLREGEFVPGTALRVIETPGHTPGGISLTYARVIFSGDTLFQSSVGRTDLCGGDQDALFHSIKEKLLTFPRETQVLPGHGPPTSVDAELNHNPYL